MEIENDLDYKLMIEKLWDRTLVKDGCWLWQGPQIKGHGVISFSETYSEFTHRLSAYLFFNFNLAGDRTKQINHKIECINKHCWCPDHIYVGTPSQNQYDSIEVGTHFNASKKMCPSGHEYTEENTKIHTRKRNNKIYQERICRKCLSLVQERTRLRRKNEFINRENKKEETS